MVKKCSGHVFQNTDQKSGVTNAIFLEWLKTHFIPEVKKYL